MLERIISGAQTVVDQDVALQHKFPCGGLCPKGRRAEDGPIPNRYPLKETELSNYRIRTERLPLPKIKYLPHSDYLNQS